MAIEIKGVGADQELEYWRACFYAFGEDPTEEAVADEILIAENDRLLAAYDAGRVVGTAAAFSFDMTLPGGAIVPVAAVTAVTVLPTHRRQGVLTRMMRDQLDDVEARGETVAVLTASEAAIYGRFGYGQATRLAKVNIDTRDGLELRAEPRVGGSLRMISEPELHSVTVAPIYDAVRRKRVGELSRSQVWWDYLQLDRERWRDDATARLCVIHEDDDGVADGYCWYRILERVTDGVGGRNEVKLWDLAAVDAEIEAVLLGYLAGIDLTTSVTGWVRPVDDPWPLRLVDARRYRVELVHDQLYVRLLDVAAALSARTYEGAGTLVVAVDDPFRPAAGGRFRLEVAGDGTATCERVGDTARGKADLRLDTSALASLFLGDVVPTVLARAGRLKPASAESLRTADRVFPTLLKPFCTSEF